MPQSYTNHVEVRNLEGVDMNYDEGRYDHLYGDEDEIEQEERDIAEQKWDLDGDNWSYE